ncbi:MAG: hypothetical protein EYC62_08115 [Alphaproteobacteria bacterium]|nr:MAG: hypothetical protein EYC62_08115 [Alphaproteobacteria bacterium]
MIFTGSVLAGGVSFAEPLIQDYQYHYSTTDDGKAKVSERQITWRNQGLVEEFSGKQVDYLVHNWRNADRSADLYVRSGYGEFETNKGLFNPYGEAMISGIEYNYQDPRIYTSAKFESYYGQDYIKKFRQELRLGLKNLDLGDDGISSMFMLVASRISDVEDGFKLTPALQLFGDDFNTEIDFDLDGEIKFNFTYKW